MPFHASWTKKQSPLNTPLQKERIIGGFSRLHIYGTIDVMVKIDDTTTLTLTGDPSVLDALETKVIDDTLTISFKPQASFSTKYPLKALITTPHLTHISAYDSATAQIKGISEGPLALNTYGSSTLTLKGVCSQVIMNLFGASTINAEKLVAENIIIKAHGASDASLNVTQALEAYATGASSIIYTGDPITVIKILQGAASLKKDNQEEVYL